MNKIPGTIERFADGDFIIEVLTTVNNESYEAWIRHKDYGISVHAIGVSSRIGDRYISLDAFLKMVETNLEGYKKFYREKYMKN